MPTPTSSVKVNPNTNALIDPVAFAFKQANGIGSDSYLTSSTTSLTLGNGSKTLTIGTGLSYSTQQDIIIANDATHYMHATVTSYDSATGVLVVDVAQHTGSGTFTSWTVNVGGIAAGVIPTGGSTGQALGKVSGSNYDVSWQTYYQSGGALGTPASGTLTNCTGLPATSIAGYVCGSYKRSGSSQTLTSATDVALIFPTSVKTSSTFAGTTFTAPATGYASAIGSFGLNCTASAGDTESGTVTVKIRDTNSNTDVIILVDAISVFFAGAGAVISNVYPILATIPVTSGHTYQVWVNWDNGGDDATTNNGSLTWEMKLA